MTTLDYHFTSHIIKLHPGNVEKTQKSHLHDYFYSPRTFFEVSREVFLVLANCT